MLARVKDLWYHVFKAKYFVERYKTKPFDNSTNSPVGAAPEVEDLLYCKLNQEAKKFEWVANPKHASIFGFFPALIIYKTMRKKHKGDDCKFALVTTGDIAFVHYVTTGERLKNKS